MKDEVELAWAVQLVWGVCVVTVTQLDAPMPESLQPRSFWLHLWHMAVACSHCPPVVAYGAQPQAEIPFWSLAQEVGFSKAGMGLGLAVHEGLSWCPADS